MDEKTVATLNRIQTGCVAVDTLTDGGLPTGTISQIFGEKALGKSIISFQAACATVGAGASAIILDTEQSYSNYLMPYWKGTMGRRFGKDLKVTDLHAERVPKSEKKNKTVTRGQLITELGSTLNRLGVAYSESRRQARSARSSAGAAQLLRARRRVLWHRPAFRGPRFRGQRGRQHRGATAGNSKSSRAGRRGATPRRRGQYR